LAFFIKDCLFGYQTHFGNLSNWYVLVCTNIPTHNMPVRTGVLMRRKKRVKRKGWWRNRGGRRRKKKEEKKQQ
ncbi:hypothetical protein BHE74_00004671, partial [Ensete ventricosum]